jgi:hypothetical protein
MTATLYGVRGISRREAVRPIREDGKGGGARITMPGCCSATTRSYLCKNNPLEIIGGGGGLLDLIEDR